MGRIMSSGCARNDQITQDKVECDPVVPGTPTRRDMTHPHDTSNDAFIIYLQKIKNKGSFNDKFRLKRRLLCTVGS